MNTEKLLLGAVVASVLAVASQSVFAHGGATGVVKDRMDGMGVMKKAMKVLTPMMRGQIDYDASVVRERSEDISRHAGEALTKLFPEGSLDAPSEAKPEVWQDWDAFSALAVQLRVMADGLAAASENGLAIAEDVPIAGGMTDSPDSGMMGIGAEVDMTGLSQMPADRVFAMMGQVCSACHTRFRAEN